MEELLYEAQERLERAKQREYKRKYYLNHRETILAKNAEWRKKHREQIRTNARTYYMNHLDEIYEKKRAYYQRKKAEKAG